MQGGMESSECFHANILKLIVLPFGKWEFKNDKKMIYCTDSDQFVDGEVFAYHINTYSGS